MLGSAGQQRGRLTADPCLVAGEEVCGRRIASAERASEIVVPKSNQTKAAAVTRARKEPAAKGRAIKMVSVKGKRSAAPDVAKLEGEPRVTFGQVSVLVTQPTEEAVQTWSCQRTSQAF